MSSRVHPSKYFVPELPHEYIGNFGKRSKTTEAKVLRILLEADTSPSPVPAIVIEGVGGSGKTTTLVAVGNHERGWARFSDAVWFIVLGQDAHPSKLLENLEEVVRSVVGEAKADEIGRLSRLQDKASAVAEAIRVLKEHDVLLLLDDVWADEQERVLGQSTVFSLVRDCVRKVQRNPGRLRAVVSTRDSGVAALVAEAYRVSAEPFQARETTAREILCRYAEVSLKDIEAASVSVQESFNDVLDRCGGLPLALAVAGSVIRDRTTFGGVEKDEVWGLYAAELEGMTSFLKHPEPQSDHPGLYAMVESSLKGVGSYMRRAGFAFSDEVKLLFSLLGVLRKQEAVPLSVVECIWGLSEEETRRMCTALARMHLVSLTKESGVQWMRVHDVIIGFCDVVLSEKPGWKALAHRGTVDRLEKSMLQRCPAEKTEDGCFACAAWWKLHDTHVNKWARDYCLRNLARHKVAAGEAYIQRLLYLISDYRWTETQVKLSKHGNNVSGIVADVQTFVTGCGNDLDETVKRGVKLIADAARLATQFVADNPQELPYQLQGRLAKHQGQNVVVDYFLWSLDRYARRPWLKAGKGVLTAAGGPVVLNATLPKLLWCVAAFPSGEDVVVGGVDGYLAVFSIRYASELYDLRGHNGIVSCVVLCAARNRIFSGGVDGTLRAWELAPGQQAKDALVKHEKSIYSLAATADGSCLVFGDGDGCLVVCDSASGGVKFKWSGHRSRVSSLAVRSKDGMIVSGSYDGTIARWESASCREIGSRFAGGGWEIHGVDISRDGNRIAFAARETVGVLDTDTGDVLRECGTESWAWCAVFGADDEMVLFGRRDGTTAVLTPNSFVISDVKAHSDSIWGIAQSHENRLLVSVSQDCSLSVQSLERADSSSDEHSDFRYELEEFVVLSDRKRILYSWWKGPRGLRLLTLGTTSPERAPNTQELINASITIGSGEAVVTAIATSRDGRYAAAGTREGEVILYNTATWRPRYASQRRLPGLVWSVAISNNGIFSAAGSDDGGVALFRVADGSEVQLPSSAVLDGSTVEVKFSEESCSLLAVVRNESQATGMLHVWKQIDQGANIEYIALPFSKISTWRQPYLTRSMIANNSHIATRDRTDSRACVYDMVADRYSKVCGEEEDDSGLLQACNREHAAFESTEALFMAPFQRTIRYCHGSSSEVLGTLETPICHRFRPEQWTYDNDTGLFVAGGFRCNMVVAVLMREHENPRTSRSKAPKLPLVHKVASMRVNNTGTRPSHYNVFISHAGPDKHDLAIPLYRLLGEKGFTAFVDKEELRPGDKAPREMEVAMETADIGIFITSPEFVCRWWPMKELSCFLRRNDEAEAKSLQPATVLPVFYRLDVHECRKADLFNKSEIIQAAADEGFFTLERQQKMSIQTVLERLRGLAGFTGIENEEGVLNDAEFRDLRADNRMGRVENRMARDRLLAKIVDAVVDVQARKRMTSRGSSREGGAKRVGGETSSRDGDGVEVEEVNAEIEVGAAVHTSRKRVAREQDSVRTERGEDVSGETRKRGRFCAIM